MIADGKRRTFLASSIAAGVGLAIPPSGAPIVGGHIAPQAESPPCQFRNIEIQVLD